MDRRRTNSLSMRQERRSSELASVALAEEARGYSLANRGRSRWSCGTAHQTRYDFRPLKSTMRVRLRLREDLRTQEYRVFSLDQRTERLSCFTAAIRCRADWGCSTRSIIQLLAVVVTSRF